MSNTQSRVLQGLLIDQATTCASEYGQCGGSSYSGSTCCKSPCQMPTFSNSFIIRPFRLGLHVQQRVVLSVFEVLDHRRSDQHDQGPSRQRSTGSTFRAHPLCPGFIQDGSDDKQS